MPHLYNILIGTGSTGPCPSSGLTASTNTVNLIGDCIITGDVNLSGSAGLTLTGGKLTIKGNVSLSGNAQLTVTNGSLSFPQTNYSQYSVVLHGNSQLKLKNSAFITNGTSQNNFSMALDAYDLSLVQFEQSTVDTNRSWLLGNFHNSSQLNVINSQNVPTEIYPSDSTSISISSGSSIAGLWLEFASGSSATVQIPTVDSQGNYNFSFGLSPGFGYSVNISASKGRLGLNSHPNSTMIVNGGGLSSTTDADVVFGYYLENSTGAVTIDGLNVGGDITRQFTDHGRNLQLNHVNLNPFSWQVYVSNSNGFVHSITNSKINEIAAFTNGLVNLSTCVLQLAITGAVAPGSQMNITGTNIWSQAIKAANGGQLTVTNSFLHGNFISADGAGSSIAMTNTGEQRNGVSPQSPAPVGGYPPNNNGVPLINPFNPPYQCSQVISPTRGATITGVPACPP